MKEYVYKLLDCNRGVLYVGRTKNLDERIKRHQSRGSKLSPKDYQNVDSVEYIYCDNEADATIKEKYFINKYKPSSNINEICDGFTPISQLDNCGWKVYETNESSFTLIANLRKQNESMLTEILKKEDIIEDLRALCEDKKCRIYDLEKNVIPRLMREIKELKEKSN